MKKFLAFFLAITAVLSLATVFTLVGASGADANNISYIDYLDFSAENNKWNERDENGKLIHKSFSSSDLVDGMYPHAIYLEDNGYNKNLSYEFVQNDEVIRLRATSTDNPGIVFDFDRLGVFKIGAEDAGLAEYVKIRFKNNSPSSKLTFMGTNQSWGAGKLDSRIRASIDVEANSSEWQTVTISMIDGMLNTTGTAMWGSTLKQFAICPFGYGADNGAVANDDYYVDIDYVVIGSKSYVEAYESALEKKENAAESLEFVSEPTKKEYFLGQPIDLEGLQASIKYVEDENGTPKYPDEILDGNGVSARALNNFARPEDLAEGEDSWEETIKIKYGSHELAYKVTVYDIKEIQFEYAEGKTEEDVITSKKYNRIKVLRQGRFLPEDLFVKVIYSKLKDDGVTYESETKLMQEVELIGTEFDAGGEFNPETGCYEYLVEVQYRGHAIYLPVQLIDIAELVVTPIDEKVNAIYYGTKVDESFFDIVCKYTDGTTGTLSDIGLANTSTAKYLTLDCNTNTTGGTSNVSIRLLNAAYGVDVTKDVEVTVQTPSDITVEIRGKANYDIDSVIDPQRFTIKYVYDLGEGKTESVTVKDDPNIVYKYDTSAPGTDIEGYIEVDGRKAFFKYNVEEFVVNPDVVKKEAPSTKVTLLAPKFPTFWLVTIIVASVIVVLVALWAILKFVFKVDFKRKKRVSLDDIF